MSGLSVLTGRANAKMPKISATERKTPGKSRNQTRGPDGPTRSASSVPKRARGNLRSSPNVLL